MSIPFVHDVLVWKRTGDPRTPFGVSVGARQLLIQLNDFPAEAMYTLLVDGKAVASFDDWPSAWTRPA